MESRSTTARNVGILFFGLIAIWFGIWRGVVADRQAKASQHQAETARSGLLNERYQKGAEMLGSPVLAVRLGGIYALQHLAEDEPEQYQRPNHASVLRLRAQSTQRRRSRIEARQTATNISNPRGCSGCYEGDQQSQRR